VGATRTTICCSAVALTALCFASLGAQTRRAEEASFALFPLRVVWTLALNNRLIVAPVYAGAHAYFAIEDDRLVAYELEHGRQEWIVQVRPLLDLASGDGLVFVAEAGMVTAIRASDGSTAWQLPVPGMLAVPPVWDNGWLILASRDGDVLAARGIDGHVVWRRSLGAPAHAPASLAADRLYVPVADGRIVALKVENGDPIWERHLPQAATALLALDDRVFAGSKDNFFYALEASDGRIAWRWRTGADLVGVPIVDERNVYFVSFDNVLRALSRNTGVQRWARLLPLRPTRGPLRVGDSVIVSGIAPMVRAYHASDGTPAGEFPSAGDVAAAPYAVPYPATGLPQVLLVTRDIAKGATATLFTRQLEGPVRPFEPPSGAVWVIPLPDARAE
jgi:outer membrane protein assembly factor BamB